MISNQGPTAPLRSAALGRVGGLAAWTLAAVAPLAAVASPGRIAPRTSQTTLLPAQETPTKPQAAVEVQRLTDAEIDGLVTDLREGHERGMAMEGDRAAISAVLTEAEARSILNAFLKKNGFEPKVVTLAPGGHPIEVDALDRARGVGVAFLPGKPPFGDNQEPVGPRPKEAIDELLLLRARGESRVLILDGGDFEYDPEGDFDGRLPTKKAAIQRLLAALEEFLRRP